MNTSNGAISGTPTAALGATTFTVTVTDANAATASNTFSLTINGGVTATQAVASTVITANHAVTAFTPVTGGGGTAPLNFSVAPALPAGLTYSASTGSISGTPTATIGATTFTVTVTD
ncbi:putative Ig domain-containing protein, partial [Xanthomonas citri pv. citri]